jgi:hypothetical protein
MIPTTLTLPLWLAGWLATHTQIGDGNSDEWVKLGPKHRVNEPLLDKQQLYLIQNLLFFVLFGGFGESKIGHS